MTHLSAIGFDADDTLWHNESIFHLTQQQFLELLKDHGDPDHMAARLFEVERNNLALYGYGCPAGAAGHRRCCKRSRLGLHRCWQRRLH